jgi:hypothetical protein
MKNIQLFSICIFLNAILPCRADDWARRAALMKDVGSKHASVMKHLVLCSEHFEDSAYYCPAQRDASRLQQHAVPTLKLFEPSVKTPKSIPHKPPKDKSVMDMMVEKPCAQSTFVASEQQQPSGSGFSMLCRRPGRPQKSIAELQQLLRTARKRISYYKRRISNLEGSIQFIWTKEKFRQHQQTHTSLSSGLHQLECSSSKLSTTLNGYIRDLMRNVQRKRPSWSVHSIRLATGVYHYSPRTARYLHTLGLLLPSRSTIRKYVGKCLRKPGPCPKVLGTLQQIAPSLTQSQRLVTISIDGMKIKPALRYEKHLDKICKCNIIIF